MTVETINNSALIPLPDIRFETREAITKKRLESPNPILLLGQKNLAIFFQYIKP
jgi:hypothetical protein